jgi:thioredoxin 1
MKQSKTDFGCNFWPTVGGPAGCFSGADELAEKLGDMAVFAKVNVEEERELAMRFGVSSIPTVIVFKDGVQKANAVGVRPARAYEEMIGN